MSPKIVLAFHTLQRLRDLKTRLDEARRFRKRWREHVARQRKTK